MDNIRGQLGHRFQVHDHGWNGVLHLQSDSRYSVKTVLKKNHNNCCFYCRYYGIYQFTRPKLVIRDPDLIRRVTVKDFDYFVDHTAMVDPKADPLFAKNLISLKGEWGKCTVMSFKSKNYWISIVRGWVEKNEIDFIQFVHEQQNENDFFFDDWGGQRIYRLFWTSRGNNRRGGIKGYLYKV